MELESKIQSKILKYLKTLPDTYVVKVVSANRGGVPDIIICHRNRFIAFEVKRLNKLPTPLQKLNHDGITKAGGIIKTVSSVEDVAAAFDDLYTTTKRCKDCII